MLERLAPLLLASLTAGTAAAAGDPGPARQAELLHRLKHDCGSCHGMTLKGGLGPALLPAQLAERSDEELVEVILDGRPGTPMPPWRFEIRPGEGLKFRNGFSALMRHSMACPCRSTSRGRMFSPIATRIWYSIRSTSATSSVTGCST